MTRAKVAPKPTVKSSSKAKPKAKAKGESKAQGFEKLQHDYIAELRAELPNITKWWKATLKKNQVKSYPGGIDADFPTRWPTEMGGHPRLIAIFRKYFLLVEKLNSESTKQVHPIDLLVNDLAEDHESLHEVMGTMFFIPIGTNEAGESC
ncbi:MAG: hypothetical protein ACTHU0_18210 [Kofleriaceae bacterium]